MANEASTWLDPLYRDYLLRDFFAKIVPGSALGVSLYVLAGSGSVQSVTNIGIGTAVLAAGVAWTLGFAVQLLAERLRILKHYPPEYADQYKRYAMRIDFKRGATQDERNRIERYAVIKEATGNMATVVAILSLLIIAVHWPTTEDQWLKALLYASVSLALIVTLAATSREHARKQYTYLSQVLQSQSPAGGEAEDKSLGNRPPLTAG